MRNLLPFYLAATLLTLNQSSWAQDVSAVPINLALVSGSDDESIELSFFLAPFSIESNGTGTFPDSNCKATFTIEATDARGITLDAFNAGVELNPGGFQSFEVPFAPFTDGGSAGYVIVEISNFKRNGACPFRWSFRLVGAGGETLDQAPPPGFELGNPPIVSSAND